MNGDEDTYVFHASGDACGICVALDGTNTAGRPHDNCQCQIDADADDCSWDYTGSTTHYGPGSYEGTFGAEITVRCADGSEIGISVPIDLGGFDPSGDADVFDFLDAAVAAEAEALCDQCPEPPLVA
jgi:hypothetical protein